MAQGTEISMHDTGPQYFVCKISEAPPGTRCDTAGCLEKAIVRVFVPASYAADGFVICEYPQAQDYCVQDYHWTHHVITGTGGVVLDTTRDVTGLRSEFPEWTMVRVPNCGRIFAALSPISPQGNLVAAVLAGKGEYVTVSAYLASKLREEIQRVTGGMGVRHD